MFTFQLTFTLSLFRQRILIKSEHPLQAGFYLITTDTIILQLLNRSSTCKIPQNFTLYFHGGPHHFPETSFYRIVVLPKRHVVECRLVELSYCRNYITSNVTLSNRYLSEGHFSDTSFSRKSFSRIDIKPNVFFSNRRLAERFFPKLLFSRTLFFRIVVSWNRRFAETSCHQMSIGRIVILPNSKIAETIYCRISFYRIGI